MSVETPSMTTAHIHAAINWRKNKIREYREDINILEIELLNRQSKFHEQSQLAMGLDPDPKIQRLNDKINYLTKVLQLDVEELKRKTSVISSISIIELQIGKLMDRVTKLEKPAQRKKA